MIPKNWIREDQLPADLSNEDFDDWFLRSRIVDGIRMGPRFPLPPIEAVQKPCRFCGLAVWVQNDNPEPECNTCEELTSEAIRDSLDVEDQLMELVGITEYGEQS